MEEYYSICLVILAWIILSLFVWQGKNYGYRCPYCHAEFQPTSWLAYLGPHLFLCRYLACPQCKRFGWAAVVREQ
jgi:hypothetical protein